MEKNSSYDNELAFGEVCHVVIRNIRMGQGIYGLLPSSQSDKLQPALFVRENGEPACYRFIKYQIRGNGNLVREIVVEQAARMSFRNISKRKKKNLESQIDGILRSKKL